MPVHQGDDRKRALPGFERGSKQVGKAGVRLKEWKCKSFQNQVEYLGHIVDARHLHPTEEKIKALQEAPRPANKAELSSYLGVLQYYMKFLPNAATVLQHLHKLKKEKQNGIETRSVKSHSKRARR